MKAIGKTLCIQKEGLMSGKILDRKLGLMHLLRQNETSDAWCRDHTSYILQLSNQHRT